MERNHCNPYGEAKNASGNDDMPYQFSGKESRLPTICMVGEKIDKDVNPSRLGTRHRLKIVSIYLYGTKVLPHFPLRKSFRRDQRQDIHQHKKSDTV